MITREQADRLREELLAALAEDAHNAQRLTERLDAITHESGIGAHAALLLILTQQPMDETEARAMWQAVLAHRDHLTAALARDVGVRVALVDYLVHVNRRLTHPTLIDLSLADARRRHAHLDATTGLADAEAFRAAVQNELRRARRYDQTTSVLSIDLDDFARHNAEQGRLVCDRLLRETAILLGNNSRDIDIAARPGEDEFALLLPETDRNGALLVAERFRVGTETFFARREGRHGPVGLTASVGVASYPDDATTAEELLRRAAEALYRAKAAGKNAIHAFTAERRRYLRFDLEPGRFEIEVLAPPGTEADGLRNLSRNGLLFTSPAPLALGEKIELRLADTADGGSPLRLQGWVVRLEALPEALPAGRGADAEELIEDRFEIGVAFDMDWGEGADDLLTFLERAQRKPVAGD